MKIEISFVGYLVSLNSHPHCGIPDVKTQVCSFCTYTRMYVSLNGNKIV